MLKNKKAKIGWGNPTPLPLIISSSVENGASRNVYIGNIDETVTRDVLFREFSDFGEIELINIVLEKKIAFVSFCDIMSAIKAVQALREVNCRSEPVLKRASRKINFGKDRCGNPFRHQRGHRETVSPPHSPKFKA
jgi:RNA recognition motif-containing protein